MGLSHSFNDHSLLDVKARSRFAAILEVPQNLFETAFTRDGDRLTKAYYQHYGHVFDRKEFAAKINLAALCCITVFAIPVALPFIGAMLYLSWSVQQKMQVDKSLLRAVILSGK